MKIPIRSSYKDPTGVIVALTEHPFYYTHDSTSWKAFGGTNFNLGGRQFDSLFLEQDEYNELETMLYPAETADVVSLLRTVDNKVNNRIDSFGLLYTDKRTVLNRLEELVRRELRSI